MDRQAPVLKKQPLHRPCVRQPIPSLLRWVRILLFSLPVLYTATSSPLLAEEIKGQVSKVLDGDTVVVRHSRGKETRIRLFGVDAPEKGQAYAEASRAFARKVALNNHVTVKVQRRDHYGRVIGIVEFAPNDSLQQRLLREGLAWVYRRYTNRADFIEAERLAKQQKRGLWNDVNPTPPWQYRRSNDIGYKAPSRGTTAKQPNRKSHSRVEKTEAHTQGPASSGTPAPSRTARKDPSLQPNEQPTPSHTGGTPKQEGWLDFIYRLLLNYGRSL